MLTSTPLTMFNPQIGDRCHWRLWTDVLPCTVIERKGNRVTVQINKVKLVKPPQIKPGGFAGVIIEEAEHLICDEFDNRAPMTFSLRKNGRWKQVGSRANEPGDVLRPEWRYYYDYGF